MSLIALLLSAEAAPPLLSPDPRGHARPDRTVDIERLMLDLDLDPDAGQVSGSAQYTVRRLSPGPLTLDYADMEIEAVVSGEIPLTWWSEGDVLKVELPEDATTVTIHYTATPRLGMHFRMSAPDAYDEVWTQGEGEDNHHWFPAFDHPNDRFIYEGVVRAPEGWQVLTNSGKEVVSYLVMVAAARYDIHTHPTDDRFSVWAPPGTSTEAVSRVLDDLPEMNAHFEARTGVAYPWGEYRQVFVQRFMYAGMENTSATVQTLRMLQPAAVEDTAGGWIRGVVAHELAHQWYGDLLTCRDWRELWLNEGFATFMAADWMTAQNGEAVWADQVAGWYRSAQTGSALAGRFHQGEGSADNGRVYVKGASVLQMLRVMLGEERFWAGVREYTTNNQNRPVITSDLQTAMESVSGANLDWFFQQWVELAYVPKLTVSHRYDAGSLTVTVRQETGEKRPRYTLPITVEIGTAGDPLVLTGWLEDDALSLVTPLSEPPRYVAFDPQGGVLSNLTQEQDSAAWAEQLSSQAPYARRMAITALAKTDLSEPLATILLDPSQHVLTRRAAAKSLGEQRSEEPLRQALADDNPAIREAAATALGKGLDRESTRDLATRVRRDRDPNVREEALKALRPRDPAEALGLARGLLRPGGVEEHGLTRAALEVIAEEGGAGDLSLLLKVLPERLWARGMTAAADLVCDLPEGNARDRATERAARFIEDAINDADVRTRSSAVAALGRLGSAKSIPHLEALKRKETVTWIADLATSSIKSIHAAQAVTPQGDNELEARLKALEDGLKAAEERLDTLSDRH
ncbi:MAG: aminopeptidase N [Myxococcota bacterium]|jgi:aminopeptidase N